MKRPVYEEDSAAFPADYYTVRQYRGVAFQVYGWELEYGTEWVTDETAEPDENGELPMCEEEYERRTGMVIAVMVGDDYKHKVDPEDLTPLDREAFCGECGAIGCTHDGLDRE